MVGVDTAQAGVTTKQGGWAQAARRLDAAIWTTARSVLVLAILLELALTFVGVWSRYIADQPIPWSEEIAGVCLNVVTFVGGAVALRQGRTMALTFFLDRMGPRLRAVAEGFGLWASLAFVAVVLQVMPAFLHRSLLLRTPVLGLPELTSAVWLPVGYALLAIALVTSMARIGLRVALAGLPAAVAAALVLFVFRFTSDQGLNNLDPAVPLALAFVLAFLCGVPIAFVLGLAAFAYILGSGSVPLAGAPVAFQSGISSFVLLAIPFFMLTGVLMDMSGMASKLVELIAPMVSRLPGGLLIAEVASVYVFSGISGSKIADIAAIGSVMRNPLRESGYAAEESTAVLAASAAMSETVPPSLTIIVLGSISSLSVGALFLGGILPALLMAIFLSIAIVYRGRRGRFVRGSGASFAAVVRAVPGAIPALLLPVVLVGGIVLGIGTPTEVSAFAAVYGFIVAALMYRRLRRAEFAHALVEASALGGMTLLILSTATLMSQMVTIDGLPRDVAQMLTTIGGRTAFLVLSVAGLVVLGSLLEGLPALLVFAPLLLPIAKALGVDQLQYGLVLIIAMGIGAFAPPIGVGLYVACAIGGSSLEKTIRPSLFYTAVLLIGLVVIAIWPPLTELLPHAAHLG